ncbi:hypothetical protein [Mesorhizobium sp.]|uniref:hypothetical protein n=1 Tax=Mesorhizobium sp. TaxID=1871066 RepID=UPI000FE8E026|nr:hypothetical protein [Mesorhizobium sp.]RWO53175.1 MAG: hypothetical protein EOS14_33625 [Mesorhizobium sp.]TIL48010.1 MAG: hypothetical protein E5Y83_33320 [Mesorhizobium sp.]
MNTRGAVAYDAVLKLGMVMGQTGKSKTCLWRWQERCAAEGFEVAPLVPMADGRLVACHVR